MLNLLLKYVEFVPNEETLKFFKEEYDSCYATYKNQINRKIHYLADISYGSDRILEDYLIYKYAKENKLTYSKLGTKLRKEKIPIHPKQYLHEKLEKDGIIAIQELKPNPYIIEQYDEEINLYGKYCGDDSLDYKVDFENWDSKEFNKIYRGLLHKTRISEVDENLTFKDLLQYLDYENKKEEFYYTKWFENIDKYVRIPSGIVPNTRLFLKDKNMTYFDYTEKYKKGEVILDENSFIDKRLKSAKTEDEKQFFGISNIDREEVLKLENEFYERKF